MNNPAPSQLMGHRSSAILGSQHGRTTTLCLAFLIATLWLATHPYHGVIHDSRFYTIEALNELIPGRFADDLYFRYGSQGQFTLFTQLYKPFITTFGIGEGNLILAIIAQCFWLTGLLYLTWNLFRDRNIVPIAMSAAIILPGGFFPEYGEPFLTPRSFAEAITFWSLGSMLCGRPIRALLLLCISITIHPLMTLPGAAVFYFYEAFRRPALWTVGALALIGSFGLAFYGVQPFARLLISFDPAWFAIVQLRDYFVFPTLWDIRLWVAVCNMFVLALLGLLIAEPNERRFLGTVCAVGVGGLTLSALGGDLFRNVLIVDIQTWRTTWLLALVAHLFVAPIFFRIQRQGELCANALILFTLAIGTLALSRFFQILSFPGAVLIVVAGVVGLWNELRNRTISIPARVFAAILVETALIIAVIFLYLSITINYSAARQIALVVLSLGAIAALQFDMTILRKRDISIAILCTAIALFTIAGFVWDQRTPWTRFIDTTEKPPDTLTSLLPGASPIYWDGDVTVPWFLLKRPSYFSCDQGTGALFSRGTAIEYQRRYQIVESLRTLDFGFDVACPFGKGLPITSITREELSFVCKMEPGLAALVLTQAAVGVPERVWVAPVKFISQKLVDGKLEAVITDKFHIYSCGDLRE